MVGTVCVCVTVCYARQVLSNGSLYVESRLAEEGTYQCLASVSGAGALLSRMARVKIACEFILHLYLTVFLVCDYVV